jgi:hypothetical protein
VLVKSLLPVGLAVAVAPATAAVAALDWSIVGALAAASG